MANEQPHRLTMKRRRTLSKRFYRACRRMAEEQLETGAIERRKAHAVLRRARRLHGFPLARNWAQRADKKKAADATLLDWRTGFAP